MDKTKVDDILIQMIEPKIKEIEERFSSGKGLNSEDVNTLLLKSQYNHINHLDQKLNEVTNSVIGLENKFEKRFVGLEGKFIGLEHKFVGLEGKFVGLENKFELSNIKIEATIQKALNKNMLMMMAMIGFFMTLSKILDIYIK